MNLVPVVIKKSRLHHSFKYWGGLLNPNKHCYVRRVTGNHNPINILKDIKKELSA